MLRRFVSFVTATSAVNALAVSKPVKDLPALLADPSRSAFCGAVSRSEVEFLPSVSIPGFNLDTSSSKFLEDEGTWTWSAGRYTVTDGINSTGITRTWLNTSPKVNFSKSPTVLASAFIWPNWIIENHGILWRNETLSKTCPYITERCAKDLESSAAASLTEGRQLINDKTKNWTSIEEYMMRPDVLRFISFPQSCQSNQGFDMVRGYALSDTSDPEFSNIHCPAPESDLTSGSFEKNFIAAEYDPPYRLLFHEGSPATIVGPGQVIPYGRRRYGGQVVLTVVADNILSKVRARAACIDLGPSPLLQALRDGKDIASLSADPTLSEDGET